MASSSFWDWKQVQDARIDNHLTGVKKESFYWLTKTIAHNRGFLRKFLANLTCHEVYLVKTKSAVSFRSLNYVTLEYFGNRALCLSQSCFHLSSIGPCNKNTAKGKEPFQGKFVVIVEDLLTNFLGKTSQISASSFSSSSVICIKMFKHGPSFFPQKGYDSVSTSASFWFKQI